jgi:lipopolysaccharide assembly outer membrane protein LptD (OstA)
MRKNILLLTYLFILLKIFSIDTTADRKSDVTSDRLLTWKERSDKLKMDTIAKDIVNADYVRLKAMARSLGLKDEDSAAAYKNVLAKYYGVKLFQVEQKKGDTITLERAGELKMFKIAEAGEEYLHIVGKVRIVLNQNNANKSNQTQGQTQSSGSRTLEANDVYIDLKNKEITGTGDVYFKDPGLEFKGNQFYYNFELNRGVLFDGRTKILQSGDSGLQGTYFDGEKIVQSDKDDAILYNGNLTTCDNEDPHYHIRVSRIWISQKGEWGILNPVIYIGQIPVFYLPIYYHPKDLIINPVFGFKSREGWYLNTTYYLFGQKTETASTAGQTSSGTGTTTGQTTSDTESKEVFGISSNRQVPQGEKAVFRITKADSDKKLTEFYEKYEIYRKNPKLRFFPNFNTLEFSARFFADAYTNLGFYFGVFYYMKLDKTSYPFQMTLLSDFALSRKLWQDTTNTDLYLPYNPSDKLISYADATKYNTYYYITENPLKPRTSQWFKFGSGDSGIGENSFKFIYDIQIEYASDVNYYKDFYGRKLDFSYIDLLADGLKYAVQKQTTKMSNFTTKTEETVTSSTDLSSYIRMDISKTGIPDILGLPLLSNISLATKTEVVLTKTNVADYAQTSTNGYVDDPLYQRYMLKYFNAPTAKFSMDGTLLDYSIFTTMPEKFRQKKSGRTENDDAVVKELFAPIQKILNKDTTGDVNSEVFDYKMMLPFFAKKAAKSDLTLDITDTRMNSYLNYNPDEIFSKTEAEKEAKPKVEKTDYGTVKAYDLEAINTEKKKSDTGLKFVNFNLKYSFVNDLKNVFEFVPDMATDTSQYDTLERLLYNKHYTLYDNLKQFTINNTLTFNLNGTYRLFDYRNSSIWQASPAFLATYKKYWGFTEFYIDYNKRINVTGAALYTSKLSDYIKTNLTNSELELYYTDKVVNDLSFGEYLFDGTNFTTDLSVRMFRFNELKSRNYKILDSLNSGNADYSPISNSENTQNDAVLYDNIDGFAYEKIRNLNTRFTFKVNCLPKDSDHSLSISAGPKINWVIPSAEIDRLKTEMWNDNSSDVIYSSETINEAKDYIYYKKRGKNGVSSNIDNKISEYFQSGNFWDGSRNFRKMLEDISFNATYNYKYKTVSVIGLVDTLSFKLDNIGSFSKADVYDRTSQPLMAYPDNDFSLKLFNDMFGYKMTLNFTKELDKTYKNLTLVQQNLDEFKIVVLSNKHIFNFKLSGNLFSFKLLNNKDWFNITSTTEFKWNKNTRWRTNYNNNLFYLDSETIETAFLMDILKISINFKSFDFENSGYGFELDNGKITLGYNVTEIPIFFEFFKFTINPSLTYDFYVKHSNYYDSSGILTQYNSSYYSNNTLTVALSTDLVIGEKTDFETKFHFEIKSENKKMHLYYNETGVEDFFKDLAKGFYFSNPSERKKSNFKLKEIKVSVSHGLHDWLLSFQYSGASQQDTSTKKYYWENTFQFEVSWKLDSTNKLMKMFNKTKVNTTYEKGEFDQPVLSLDPDAK